MSRWFRHYAGMMRDEKLVRVALRAKQPIERVLWVWGVILESAAEINDGGRYEVDHAECAYFLRVDEGDIAAIEDALSVFGRVREGSVGKWGDRQFQSDRSANRQQRYRERHREGSQPKRDSGEQPSPDAATAQSDGQVTASDVTSDGAEPSRGCDSDDGVTHSSVSSFLLPFSDSSCEDSRGSGVARARSNGRASDDWPPAYQIAFWAKYPNKVGKRKAFESLEQARKRGVSWDELWGGLCRYCEKTDDRAWCNPATWLNQDRWTDEPATSPNGHGVKDLLASADRVIAEAEARERTVDLGPEEYTDTGSQGGETSSGPVPKPQTD